MPHPFPLDVSEAFGGTRKSRTSEKKVPGRERETPSPPAQNRPFRRPSTDQHDSFLREDRETLRDPGAEGTAGDDFRGLPAL